MVMFTVCNSRHMGRGGRKMRNSESASGIYQVQGQQGHETLLETERKGEREGEGERGREREGRIKRKCFELGAET